MQNSIQTFDPLKEFDRQMMTLINKKYHQLLNCSKEGLITLLTPLREKLKNLDERCAEADIENGYLPFVITIPKEIITAENQISRIEKDEKKAVCKLYPHQPSEFIPLESLRIPQEKIYLLLNIDRGKKYVNVTPNEAFAEIAKEKRTPLTIEEGLAVITHFPEYLQKNNCFSLLGSRIKENKRVPAIWINSKKEPNLGWCWAGNPHTWLGSASAQKRFS